MNRRQFIAGLMNSVAKPAVTVCDNNSIPWQGIYCRLQAKVEGYEGVIWRMVTFKKLL